MKTVLQICSLFLCISLLFCLSSCSIFEEEEKYESFFESNDKNTQSDTVSDAMAGDGKIYAKGIDVSKWQKDNIDFKEVKEAGFDFVIIRCGSSNGKDECFEDFYAAAKAAGLDVGTYYYSYATTAADASFDAQNCIDWIKDKKFEYPVYFDFEDPTQITLDTTVCANICKTFLQKMKAAGYLVGLYSMASMLEQKWVTSFGIRAEFEGWIAHFQESGSHEEMDKAYNKKYGMYQYTEELYINESGPYDANVCYKDYPTIIKNASLNGYDPFVN